MQGIDFLEVQPNLKPKYEYQEFEDFAKENGLTAHTLSAYRWYFQSDDRLLEDGFIELQCKTNYFKHEGSCTFNVVDIEAIDKINKEYNINISKAYISIILNHKE